MNLTGMGYACEWTETLKGVLSKKDEYEVILLDLVLPDSRGLGTLIAVRAAFRSAVICVVSGYINDADTIGIIAAGADTCAHKPITVERLRRDVEDAVRRKRNPGCVAELRNRLEAMD